MRAHAVRSVPYSVRSNSKSNINIPVFMLHPAGIHCGSGCKEAPLRMPSLCGLETLQPTYP
ncbi:unnamed protein product [Chondrus crispus]|uniref:Uncharacterized protein n=1 Tax=Chondrus crispus TaxID=2769 RepID=R7QCH1_CHOCR|nr:unnamed protein product [Chondrus crispus]CDF35111.1 unnamed protein product [Chondrus crispus]|eukprot:XP_005714930.1 unnamed protein product [Chondrus crispus]